MNRYIRIGRLNKAFQYVDDRFLDLVEKERKAGRRRHLGKIRAFLGTVAACVCLAVVLPGAALAYNWFGLRELILPEEENGYVSLTLGEYAGKPEVAALREWKQFVEGYDTEATLYAEAVKEGFSTEGRKDWQLYGVYTREMGETLDQIAKQYGLMLHTGMEYVSGEELEGLAGGSFLEGVNVENCRVYENGSFHFVGTTELDGIGAVFFRFSCAGKGFLDENIPFRGHRDGYAEWQYDTADGESLRLALGTYDTRILKESADRYIIVDMPYGSHHGITEENLQELAEKLDFGMVMDMQMPGISREKPVRKSAMISLSGYMESPETQAFAEWQEFLAHYDTDDRIADAVGNGVFVAEGREDWGLYSVYSYEMGEKLDEIAAKYGLKLHTEVNIVDRDDFIERVGGCFMDREVLNGAYIYEDGYFGFDGDVELPGCGMTDFQFTRSVKGTFNEVMLTIGQAEDFTEWQYVAACGEPVLLALGPGKALILADSEECFITVNVLRGTEEGMTQEDLQELADKIDFRILEDVAYSDGGKRGGIL